MAKDTYAEHQKRMRRLLKPPQLTLGERFRGAAKKFKLPKLPIRR